MINPFDLDKKRELKFLSEPAGQAARALDILNGLGNLKVFNMTKPNCLEIHYNLCDYTLSGLERALEKEGFLLDKGLLHSVARNLVYYCEDTSLHNLEIRGHITKKNETQVFLGVSGTHTHQEQSARPPELREYE
jgi:hypothetical protein